MMEIWCRWEKPERQVLKVQTSEIIIGWIVTHSIVFRSRIHDFKVGWWIPGLCAPSDPCDWEKKNQITNESRVEHPWATSTSSLVSRLIGNESDRQLIIDSTSMIVVWSLLDISWQRIGCLPHGWAYPKKMNPKNTLRIWRWVSVMPHYFHSIIIDGIKFRSTISHWSRSVATSPGVLNGLSEEMTSITDPKGSIVMQGSVIRN